MSSVDSGKDVLPPQLYNFVLLLAAVLLGIWLVRALARLRHLYDLKAALQTRNVIRLDGLSSTVHDAGPISRAHLQQVLTARSRFTAEAINQHRVPFHVLPKSVKIAVGGAQDQPEPCLAFRVSSIRPFSVSLMYGVTPAPVHTLYSLHDKAQEILEAEQEQAVKAALDKPASSSKQPAPPNSKKRDSVDVVNFLDRAWDSFSASNISQSPARNFAASAADVKITLSLPALLNAVDLGDRVFTLALFLQDTALIDDESKESMLDPLSPRHGHERYGEITLIKLAYTRAQLLQVISDVNKPPAAAASTSLSSAVLLSAQQAPSDSAEARTAPASAPAPKSGGASNGSSESDFIDDDGDEDQTSDARRTSAGPAGAGAVAPPPGTPMLARSASELQSALRCDGQIVVSSSLVLELQDVYGIDDPDGLECTVCLSEPKDIIPLPCRHCCICHTCFQSIQGKCPVCRSQILSFMKFSATDSRVKGATGGADTNVGGAGGALLQLLNQAPASILPPAEAEEQKDAFQALPPQFGADEAAVGGAGPAAAGAADDDDSPASAATPAPLPPAGAAGNPIDLNELLRRASLNQQ